MKKYKYFPFYFFLIICFFIIGQRINFVVRGNPINIRTWNQIWERLPYFTIWAIIMAFVFNQITNNLNNNQKKDIIKAKKRITDRVEFHSQANTHECRVCGYYSKDYPWGEDGKSPSFQICPCCGVQYGIKDITPEEIQNERKLWVKNNYKWFNSNLKPAGWSSEEQLKNIPIIGTGEDNV